MALATWCCCVYLYEKSLVPLGAIIDCDFLCQVDRNDVNILL